MLTAQSIYGPHACDQWDGGEVSLGRRLFRLLPEDVHDNQPLLGAGGRLVLVADVRLDNRDDLEASLNIPTARARQLCDAAILLAAWERWGEAALDRLVGVYAFAIWDRENRAFVLVRDEMSQRPLHYHRAANFFAFASMPKGLHALEQIPRAPDETRTREFLASMPEYGTASFYAGVERVEAGCLVTVTASSLHSRRFWRPERRPIKLASSDDYAAALRDHLDRAVRAQLRGAEGRVGAHLSGGLDSSAVAATAARLLAPVGGQVVAFTAVPREGYAGPAPVWAMADEGPLAASVAAQYPNIEHVPVRTTGRLQTETLDRDHFIYDRPTANVFNNGWWHEINRRACERGLAIVLMGANGNLSLTYNGLDALPELIGQGRIGDWWRLARLVVRAGTMRWRGALFYSLGPWAPGPLWNWLNRIRGGYAVDVPHWSALNPALIPGLNRAGRMRSAGFDHFERPSADPFHWRTANLIYSDRGNYNKGDLGGWGIDLRDPTSDRRLFEFCLNIPTEQFIAGGVPRAFARHALTDRLPGAVLAERRRGRQAADWHEAATAGRRDLAEQVARLEQFEPAARMLDLPRLRKLVDNWPDVGWESDRVSDPYRHALLRGLSVGQFLRRASGSNR
jgi:asparagine synthase (glutamine-hydrolysing)